MKNFLLLFFELIHFIFFIKKNKEFKITSSISIYLNGIEWNFVSKNCTSLFCNSIIFKMHSIANCKSKRQRLKQITKPNVKILN